jgi:hypothetical protein
MAATPERQVGRFSNSNAAGVGHRGSAESVAQVRQYPSAPTQRPRLKTAAANAAENACRREPVGLRTAASRGGHKRADSCWCRFDGLGSLSRSCFSAIRVGFTGLAAVAGGVRAPFAEAGAAGEDEADHTRSSRYQVVAESACSGMINGVWEKWPPAGAGPPSFMRELLRDSFRSADNTGDERHFFSHAVQLGTTLIGIGAG